MEKYKQFNVYTVTDSVTKREAEKPQGIAQWRNVENISVRWMGQYNDHKEEQDLKSAGIPIFDFKEITMPRDMREKINERGFKRPTAVQSQAWPLAMTGLDVVAIAETGSGKTLAFGLPAFSHCRGQPALMDTPRCIVVAPTRELVIQIRDELRTYSSLSVECAYGGTRVERLGAVHVAVFTPGRLMDLLKRNYINFNKVTYMVLDEADRMLDASFRRDVETISSYLPKERQTLMFTATWPKEVASVAKLYMKDGWVQVGVGYEYLKAGTSIRQHVWVLDYHKKWSSLLEILRGTVMEEKKKALVFVNSRALAVELSDGLWNDGITAFAMSGQFEQFERAKRLNSFRNHKPPAVLISTDLLQRGLDVSDLSVVINYDMPKNIEDYTHRIGRTGRAGVVGDSYTFINMSKDYGIIPHLVRVLKESRQEVPEQLRGHEAEQGGRTWGGNDDPDGWGIVRDHEAPKTAGAATDGDWGTGDDDWADKTPKDDWEDKTPKDDWAAPKEDDWGHGASSSAKDDWGTGAKDTAPKPEHTSSGNGGGGGWGQDEKWEEKDSKWSNHGNGNWSKNEQQQWPAEQKWKEDEWKKDQWNGNQSAGNWNSWNGGGSAQQSSHSGGGYRGGAPQQSGGWNAGGEGKGKGKGGGGGGKSWGDQGASSGRGADIPPEGIDPWESSTKEEPKQQWTGKEEPKQWTGKEEKEDDGW